MGEVAKDLAAGTVGGTTQLICGHPFDTIKVKLQSQPIPPRGQPLKYAGAFDAVRQTVVADGSRGLYQFFPQDFSKVMVSCGDSQVRILDRLNVVGKYKGVHNTTSLLSACLTSDGKHIVSACEDSNVNIWNCDGRIEAQGKTSRSCECFSTNASIAIPWSGMKPDNIHLFKVSNPYY